MEIRLLKPEDYVQHNRVASQSFIYKCDIYSDKTLPCQTMPGAFIDGVLAADMEIYFRECNYFGDKLSCAAVGGVASKPEYRNKGAVRALFNALFEGKLIEKAFDISILYPFSEGYYRKFGYESPGIALSLTVPFTELDAMPKNGDVILCEKEQLPRLLELYNEAVKSSELSFVRTDDADFSMKPYLNTEYTYMHVSGDLPDAFATFSVDREADTVNVKELGFLDMNGLRGILGFLRCYEGNQSRISFGRLPADSPVFFCLKGAVHPVCSAYSVGAVRIMNVKNVLEKKKYPLIPGSFALEIIDPDIPGNSGIYTVEYGEGKCEVRRANSGKPDVTLSPRAASKLIFGGVQNETALGCIPGARVHSLNPYLTAAFPVSFPFFSGSF